MIPLGENQLRRRDGRLGPGPVRGPIDGRAGGRRRWLRVKTGEMRRERANAVDRAVVRIGSLVGPLLAGVLITLIGASNVLLVDPATFLASATLEAADQEQNYSRRHLPGGSAARPRRAQTVLGRGTSYRTVSVGERTEPMDSNTPMRIIPEKRFEEVPDPFVIIVPGGGIASLKAMGNERLINYLRFAEHTAELVGSVSTGAFVLAAAGLLEGRQATTHWAYYKILEELGAKYIRRRWVEDGKFISSAGVSAGIDMALHLAARLTDEETARRVQQSLGYDPIPLSGAWTTITSAPCEPG